MKRVMSAVALCMAVLTACLASFCAPASAQGGAVTVTRAGEGCPYVRTLALPVESGCVMRGRVERSALRLITPLGLVPAAYCKGFDLQLAVDDEGSLWIDDVHLSYGNPCGDIRSCEVPGTYTDLPWSGSLRMGRAGEVYAQMQVCFDTCFGHFEGKMRLELERDGQAWKLRADEAQIGDSAFEVDAQWRLRGSNGLEIERDRGPR